VFGELVLGFCHATSTPAAMMKPRQLIYALLCASAAVNAYPRADQPSISFSHNDWTADGTTWTVSTSGANAVLLKMDEFQGRLDTPGALVRKGSKPESNVLPPLAPPEITAGTVNPDSKPIKLTAAQTRDLTAALRTTIKDGFAICWTSRLTRPARSRSGASRRTNCSSRMPAG
jgi:hypothetical protein